MNCMDAEFKTITRDYIEVEITGGECFRLSFDRYPYFRHCSLEELENVHCDGLSLEWPDAMIDLELDLLRHPEREGHLAPVESWLKVREELRRRAALKVAARRAGSTLSARKAAASRANGIKGGRPRKKPIPATR